MDNLTTTKIVNAGAGGKGKRSLNILEKIHVLFCLGFLALLEEACSEGLEWHRFGMTHTNTDLCFCSRSQWPNVYHLSTTTHYYSVPLYWTWYSSNILLQVYWPGTHFNMKPIYELSIYLFFYSRQRNSNHNNPVDITAAKWVVSFLKVFIIYTHYMHLWV